VRCLSPCQSPLITIPDWILSANFLVSELQWNYNWNYICLHIHVVASGSQDIISQSDGLPPADTHLQQTKKRGHPMHTYKCPRDRKKTQQTKPMTHGSRPSSIAYQVIIRYGKRGSMEEVWRVLVSCFCSIIIYSSAHLPPWKLCQCSSATTDFGNQWQSEEDLHPVPVAAVLWAFPPHSLKYLMAAEPRGVVVVKSTTSPSL